MKSNMKFLYKHYCVSLLSEWSGVLGGAGLVCAKAKVSLGLWGWIWVGTAIIFFLSVESSLGEECWDNQESDSQLIWIGSNGYKRKWIKPDWNNGSCLAQFVYWFEIREASVLDGLMQVSCGDWNGTSFLCENWARGKDNSKGYGLCLVDTDEILHGNYSWYGSWAGFNWVSGQ
ncbi:hypothetical protein L1987_32965 [Smallanthus sonchifolius]|uniref:Uncharacterized protein n=1 Tax=Smallanthus sonchifolius TaxID=185202 RepID=A0ACB9HQ10_9ASTR|nr:hypothetical protein L1987_32965 [Smallanthus sonchifolius]